MENLLAELAYELKVLGLPINANKVKGPNNLWIKAAAKDLMTMKVSQFY